ncbi:hypothetical protein ACK1X7_07325 [Streptomyces sp. CY1]|uniref:hypothetical protein n=1 Tax=Streptomyces sp. CY1 TaxID=3388313 RepID=UPI0039A381D1
MATTFEAFLWSLTQQESGGNYRAIGPWVNGDRAYGRYQVMGANVGAWTARYYGRRLTPQQYLANSAAQDAVVRGVLGGYYKKYGARGAAAMWYSGQPNPNKTYGNPPVYKYVNSIMTRAGGYSGQKVGGGYSPSAPVTVKLSSSELAERYGLSSRLINSSSELKRLFSQAVAGQWSAARFQASLKNSKWWRTQSSTLRKYITLQATDPATFKQNWKNAQYKVNQLAVQVGVGNQINGKGGSSAILKEAIYNALALGWSDARIKDWLGSRAKVNDGIMWGEAGEAWDKLHEIAYLNGMKYSTDWYKRNSTGVASGKVTVETVEDHIRSQAAARFKNFADQIKAGQNAMDLAAPYIKSLSTLLELPETDVDLFEKHIYNAMAGDHAGQNFPLWQFENYVRNDPRWKKTNNARESMMTVARQVAKDFGMAY